MYETLGNYGFGFITDVKNVPISIRSVGIEKRSNASYYLNNRHRDNCYLFQYTLSGSGTVVIGGEKKTVCEGQGFLLKMPADEEYYFDEETNTAPWHFIYMMFYGDACVGYYNLVKEKFGNILTLTRNAPSILTLTEIYRLARKGGISDSFHGERLAFEFLTKLCSDLFGKPDEYSEIVIKAKEIMDSEFCDLDGIFDIAERLGVSQNHLSRVFSAETKTAPIAYLTKLRLGKAVNLLTTGNDCVEEIAVKCGFSNGNYFCKVFRKHMGLSPLEYRRRNKVIIYDRITV